MKIYHVDAFSDVLFKGNPAGVCIAGGALSDQDMQNIAMEMNLSETAFVREEGGAFHLRWFSPIVEVELCGHATLATAHVLWERGMAPKGRAIAFQTRSGVITAYQKDGLVFIDMPAKPEQAVEPPGDLLDALGVPAVYVGRSHFDFLVEVEDVETLKNMWPNMSKLVHMPGRAVCVTAKGEQFDFVSRFFAPQVGVDEDPVTGSAHCVLAPYWAKKLGKTAFRALQASKRRGVLNIELKGDRVHMGGGAVIFLEADILL